ncbi:hypothetical protein C4573_07220 [Candidatus Woesearchaeota archaeon]|nr:MAG: hypothetical protein C4573_07220 [Candidatus Woesearchaeota archaeon]
MLFKKKQGVNAPKEKDAERTEAKKDTPKKEGKVIKKDVLRALTSRRRLALAKRKHLRFFLDKAGYEDIDDVKLKKNLLYRIPIIICIILTVIAISMALILSSSIFNVLLIIIFGVWIAGYAVILILEFLVMYLFLDFKTYQRKKQIEDVLADFLQLTSSNISAGMPIDKALWFAVRPKFGVLAREIEQVAKATLTGEDLAKALKIFIAKYDSAILTRSINLLLEGMEGGGEIADLLNKIALNIQETRIMRKQMAADVLTYVIFITFATVGIAPFLFALSTQLLKIIKDITSNIDVSASQSFSFTADAVNLSDFKVFAVVMLMISSVFSALIIATIQKGSPREGLKYIPIFWLITILLYMLGNWAIGGMMSGLL